MPDNPSPIAPAPTAAPTPSSNTTTGNQPTVSDAQAAREYFDPSKHVPKSEFTKLRQRDAAARSQHEQAVRQREAQIAERERQLMQAAYAMQQRAQGGQQDPYAKIRELPYVDGNTVADLVHQLKNTDIGSIAQAIQQRDRALNFLHDQITELRKNYDAINRNSAESEFTGRLSKTRESLGLPDAEWATEFLKDIYLSHQGPDLADEFPNMARTRLDAVRKAIRELDKAEAQKARQLAIPSSGGTAAPALKLKEGYKTPKERADEVWPLFNRNNSDE